MNEYKIIVYSDVHANLEALTKLQECEDYKTADLRIFCGDAVSKCPNPNEVVNALFNSGDILLMGNHDSIQAFGYTKSQMARELLERINSEKYMASLLTKENKERLKHLPKTYELKIAGKNFLFTHYGWKSQRNVRDKVVNKTEENMYNLFKRKQHDYIVYGHIHQNDIFDNDKIKYVCNGSIGVRYPGQYTLITIAHNNIVIDQKKLYYDYEKTIAKMKAANYPRVEKYMHDILKDI